MSEHEDVTPDPDVAAVAGQAPTPAPEIGQEQEQPDPSESAFISATIAMAMTEKVVTTLWPVVEFSEEERQTFVQRLQPVLLKYDAGLPPWLAQWKEELELAAFVGLAGFNCWQRVQASKEPVDDGKTQESGAT